MIIDMALGDFKLFEWKSKEKRQQEQEEYDKWAFPHGKDQRKKLEALMLEVAPDTKLEFSMMAYLTCKELYERYLKEFGSRDKALDYMINDEKKYNQLIKKNEMTRCLAFVLANEELDENCEYPAAEEINQRIHELDELKRKKKRFL